MRRFREDLSVVMREKERMDSSRDSHLSHKESRRLANDTGITDFIKRRCNDTESSMIMSFLSEYLEPKHGTLHVQQACNLESQYHEEQMHETRTMHSDEFLHDVQQQHEQRATMHCPTSESDSSHLDTLYMTRPMLVDLMIYELLVVCSQTKQIPLPDPRLDEKLLRRRLQAAFECFENKTLVLLIAGASGSGKSAIATKIGQKLAITRNISTDTIRAVSRTHIDKSEMPELFLSTYVAGEALDEDIFRNNPRERILEGYRRQCAFVESRLEMLIDTYLTKRRDPSVIEGVHLSPAFLKKLQQMGNKRCIFVPCVLYCPNAANHRLRFARRGGSTITLDPEKNKYIRHFDNIRIIQDYIIATAQEHEQNLIENRRDEMENAIDAIHNLVLDCVVMSDGYEDEVEGDER